MENTFYFQAPANHLISASVMSAPAALAMSKLFYPETKKSKTTAKDVDCMEKRWRFSNIVSIFMYYKYQA